MTLPANVAQYLFSIPCLGQDEARNLKVVAFDHRESMSSLYQCDVVVACEDPDLVSSELIGRSGRLIVMNPSQARYIHGEITALYRGERNNRNYLYRFRLEPKLAFLQYRSDQRIFQNMTVPDIVRAVLDAAGKKAALWAIEASEKASAAAPGQLREKGGKVHIATADENAALAAVMRPAFDAAFGGGDADSKTMVELIKKLEQ